MFDTNNPEYSEEWYHYDGKLKSRTVKNPDPSTKDVWMSVFWIVFLVKFIICGIIDALLAIIKFLLVLFGIKKTYKR